MSGVSEFKVEQAEVAAQVGAWGYRIPAPAELLNMAAATVLLSKIPLAEVMHFLAGGKAAGLEAAKVDILTRLTNSLGGLREGFDGLLALMDRHPYFSKITLPKIHPDMWNSEVCSYCSEARLAVFLTPAGLPCLVFPDFERLRAWKQKGHVARARDLLHQLYGDRFVLGVAPREVLEPFILTEPTLEDDAEILGLPLERISGEAAMRKGCVMSRNHRGFLLRTDSGRGVIVEYPAMGKKPLVNATVHVHWAAGEAAWMSAVQ